MRHWIRCLALVLCAALLPGVALCEEAGNEVFAIAAEAEVAETGELDLPAEAEVAEAGELDLPAENEAEALPIPEDGRELFFPGDVREDWIDLGADSDTLLEGYLERLFGVGKMQVAAPVGELLEGKEARLYALLKGYFQEVASGRRASTVFSFNPADLGLEKSVWTGADLGTNDPQEMFETVNRLTGVDTDLVYEALLADCPFELYWLDKTQPMRTTGFRLAYFRGKVTVESDMTMSFPVAGEYAGGTSYTMNTALAQTAQRAAENAQAIVREFANASDYDKLYGYANRICGLTDYNYDAADGGALYGNPWQLVWVFDGDSATKVVCEGYAKAFKYLCDSSRFSGDVSCYLATGYLFSGGGYGSHMWNLVNMENGKSYLVDVTCMDQSYGVEDEVFLSGYNSVGVNGEYVVNASGSASSRGYLYDDGARRILPSDVLALSVEDYLESHDTTAPVNPQQPAQTEPEQPAEQPQPAQTEPEQPAEQQPAQTEPEQPAEPQPVEAVLLTVSPGAATLQPGQALPLQIAVEPVGAAAGLSFTSSNPSVAWVSEAGVVTALKKGSAVIMVLTENGLFQFVRVQVVPQPTKVKLNKKGTVALKKGKKLTLKATLTPQGATSKLTWKSSNKKVATVTAKGVVKAKKPGTATITVTTENGKKAKVKIKVTK